MVEDTVHRPLILTDMVYLTIQRLASDEDSHNLLRLRECIAEVYALAASSPTPSIR